MKTLDELEGDGISYQDPWEYGIKNIITRDDYEIALSISFCQEKGTQEQQAWAMVINTITQNPYMTNNAEERTHYLKINHRKFLEAIELGELQSV